MRSFLILSFLFLLTGRVPVFAEGGEGGVEAALVTFSDARAGFSIGHPGTWTQDSGFGPGARFVGGDDSMTVVLVALPPGTTVEAFATKDASLVSKEFTGFRQLSLKPSKDRKGAWILGFETQGRSAVTGKPFAAHNERYYVPLSGSRIGLVTLFGPDTHYDLEGMRDIALTLVVRK